MPQPAFNLASYLENPLPPLKGELPIGVGSAGARPSWNEGKLTKLAVIDDFGGKVKTFLEGSVPKQPVPTHPGHPFPHLVSAARSLTLNSDSDTLKALKTLPLSAGLAVLAAWDLQEHDNEATDGSDRIVAPTEADGERSFHDGKAVDRVQWTFGRTPMGETEFLLVGKDSKPVMVVRVVLDNVFSAEDWEEFSVTGTYRYNPKSKASWLWSRQANGTARLGVKHFVLTSYNKWVFGVFNDDRSSANVSPVLTGTSTDPTTVLAALTYWARSALKGNEYTFVEPQFENGQADKTLFPTNPARRASTKRNGGGKEESTTSERVRPEKRTNPKLAAESDVEESDAAEAN